MATTAQSISANWAAARQRQVDSLVANYAPLGLRHRRSERRKRIAAFLALLVLLAAGAMLLATDTQIFAGSKDDAPQLGELRELLAVELGAISAERQELEQYKQIFEERSNELGAQIAEVNAQWTDLATKRQQFESQSALLAELINDIDSARQTLKQRQDPEQLLDQEISAISAQRIALEKRWKQFEAQGELLATEIIAVSAQRRELEAQRKLMDRQQSQLQALIDRAIDMDDRTQAGDENATKLNPAEQTGRPEQIAYAGPLAVGDDELGRMRGGISIGDGLEVALGITHTGSINGVEQFSNNFVIDDLNSDISSVDLSDMNAILIQNGHGNFAAPNMLDSLSGSLGSTIQNSLDDQSISTTTIYDISVDNIASAMQGLAATQALTDSLSLSH